MYFRLLWCWFFLAWSDIDFQKEPSGVSAAPLVPISVASTPDQKTNPDVVAMLIDLDKVESDLKNPGVKSRSYDLDPANSDAEKQTKKLLGDLVAQRSLPLPDDKAQLDNNILAISLLRNRNQKKIGQRWNFEADDEVNDEGNDEISKIVQVILHKGNGVSVTIQDGKGHNRGR